MTTVIQNPVNPLVLSQDFSAFTRYRRPAPDRRRVRPIAGLASMLWMSVQGGK